MPDDTFKAFPLRGSSAHKPFDKTIKSLTDESPDIKRRSFTDRLQRLPFFKTLFFTDPTLPSEYRFPISKDHSLYTINLHWESVPLLRAYCNIKTQWTRDQGEISFNQDKSDILSKYKKALENEKGQYFSAFRDTDPLYRNLVMKEKVLELLPERLSLLIVSTILGSAVGSAGRLKATIDIIDAAIEQNIAAIIGNDLSAENFRETLQNTRGCFCLERSIEALYTKLESERQTDNRECEFVFNDRHYNTLGIKTYPEILDEDIAPLNKIIKYLLLADKDSEENKKYQKRKKPVSLAALKVLEKEAEAEYDTYRKNHLPCDTISRAGEFKRALDFLESPNIGKSAIEMLNDDYASEHFIRFILLSTLDKEGYLFCSIPCFTKLETEASLHKVFMSDSVLIYDCHQTVSEIAQKIFPFFKAYQLFAAGEEKTLLCLEVFASFLINEVFNDLSGSHLDISYINESIYLYLNTDLYYEPDFRKDFHIDANEIINILNITNRNDIKMHDKGNLIVLWKALLNAWVIRCACEEANKYVVNKRKIIEFKQVLLKSIFGSESGVDERVFQNIRKSVDEIYKQIFESSSSTNDNSLEQT